MKYITLYKFLKFKDALSVLKSGQLKVSKYDDVNDPYEIMPSIYDRDTGMALDADKISEWFIGRLALKHGFLSFSRTHKESVLWAHYADNHKGIALEFKCPYDRSVLRVKYSKERTRWDFTKLLNPQLLTEEEMLEVLCRKSRSWAYEKEFRMFVPLEGCYYRNSMHFAPIPDDILTKVVVGCRFPDKKLSRLKNVVKKSRFSNVEVSRVRLDDATFDMKMCELAKSKNLIWPEGAA